MTGDPCGGNVTGGTGCKCAPPFGTAQHATTENDELARLRGIVAAVETLVAPPLHECNEICEEWGCDYDGRLLLVPGEQIRKALAGEGA